MAEPLVSISCITFNHEKYIRKCLDGFLMQKTSFEFEILIHDDASTDDTANIIKEFEARFPKIIKPIYQTENQYSLGTRGMNIKYNFPRAKGNYIAICEGDDYWIDPMKLQKQFDLLQADSEISGCFHSCEIQYANDSQRQNRKIVYDIKNSLTFGTYLKSKYFITTGSLFFKKEVLVNMPPFVYDLFAGDFILKYLISSYGKFGYIKDCMSVYRKGVAGSWSNRNITPQVINREYYDNLRALLYFDNVSNHNYHKEIEFKCKYLLAKYLFMSSKSNGLGQNFLNFFLCWPYLSFRELIRFSLNSLKNNS